MLAYLVIKDAYGWEISILPFSEILGGPAKGRAVLAFSDRKAGKGAFELEPHHMVHLRDCLNSIIEGSAVARNINAYEDLRRWERVDFEPRFKALWRIPNVERMLHFVFCDDTGQNAHDIGGTDVRRDFEDCPCERMPQPIFEKLVAEQSIIYERLD